LESKIEKQEPSKSSCGTRDEITINGLWFGTKEGKVYTEARSAREHLEP